MNLDQVTIEIRPRQAWEAVDLGILMAKRWWLPMMQAWLLVSLPFLALGLLVPVESLWLSTILLWWLKPLFERPLLHILSHAVFNDLPSVRSTVKAFPSLAIKQIFASLTWRRLSPSRSMDLAVLQLEGLSGARRQERLRVLHREDSAPAGWLTFLGANIEGFLGLGIAGIIWAMVPQEIDIDWANVFLDEDSAHIQYTELIIWYITMTLVAPFYVACGFALYLNRRIKLEAWDIDIAFRRIVNKRDSNSGKFSAKTNSTHALLLALALGIGLFAVDASTPAYAQHELPETVAIQAESDADYDALNATELSTSELATSELTTSELATNEYTHISDRSAAKKIINKVMQQEEFSHKETERHIKFFEPDKDSPPDEDNAFIKWLLDFLKNAENSTGIGIASGLEFILWGLVIALIFWVVFRYRHWLAAQFVRVKAAPEMRKRPVTLFGMAVTRESLPADISSAALQLLQQNDTRAAIALLYRACLYRLIYVGVDIEDGHTENECLALMRAHFSAKQNAAAQINYFSQLSIIWQRLAYGHLTPEQHIAQQLCSHWNSCWLSDDTSSTIGVK